MAMTKKERAEFDAALHQARMLGALRWTTEIKPDIPPPKSGEPDTSGWACSYSGYVDRGWSSSVYHGSGARRTTSASQQPQSLYSTELLAVKASRHITERKFALELAWIDERIAALELAPQPTKEE